MADEPIDELLSAAKELASQPVSARPVRSYPAATAETVEQAAELAQHIKRPVLSAEGGRPVTVFPKGTRPAT